MLDRPDYSISQPHNPSLTSGYLEVQVDLEGSTAYVDPVWHARPDLGPDHIRSVSMLFPGQQVELITFTREYQACEQLTVYAIQCALDPHKPHTLMLSRTEASDSPRPGALRRSTLADVGLQPYRDATGRPTRWNENVFLLNPPPAE